MLDDSARRLCSGSLAGRPRTGNGSTAARRACESSSSTTSRPGTSPSFSGWSSGASIGSTRVHPEDADALVEGRYRPDGRDRILFTFDDGLATQHTAAEWLASQGLRACFFLVPSLLDRTFDEFVAHHRSLGVAAHAFVDPATRSMSVAQAREIASMGHRVGAHNDAHRDLMTLQAAGDLDYEIGGAVAQIADLLGGPCRDFAFGFGQPSNLSSEAAGYLRGFDGRVFAGVRGLNVPGKSPASCSEAPSTSNTPGRSPGSASRGGPTTC